MFIDKSFWHGTVFTLSKIIQEICAVGYKTEERRMLALFNELERDDYEEDQCQEVTKEVQ